MSQVKTSVDVIVCVHNALEDVKECLNSVLEHNSYGHGLILVDDGSQSDTETYLKGFAQTYHIPLLRHEEAKGYTGSANDGLHTSTAEIRVMLNSDTIVTAFWIEKMVDLFEKYPDTGIVSPLSNSAGNQSVPKNLDITSRKYNLLPVGMNPEFMNKIVEQCCEHQFPTITWLNGFCFMIHKKVLDTIGYLDEEHFKIGYAEEVDFCIRARKAGFSLRVLENTYIFHERSKSFGTNRATQMMKKGTETLKVIHGEEEAHKTWKDAKFHPEMSRIRKTVEKAQKIAWETYQPLMKQSILFILPYQPKPSIALPYTPDPTLVTAVTKKVNQFRSFGLEVSILKKRESYLEEKQTNTIYFENERQKAEIISLFDVTVETAGNLLELIPLGLCYPLASCDALFLFQEGVEKEYVEEIAELTGKPIFQEPEKEDFFSDLNQIIHLKEKQPFEVTQEFYIFTADHTRTYMATTWVRVLLPWLQQKKLHPHTKFHLNPSLSTEVKKKTKTYVLFQRIALSGNTLEEISTWLSQFEDVTILFELDDDLLHIDPSHVAYHVYESARKHLLFFAEKADYIIATTKEILTRFTDTKAEKIIIPNYIEQKLFPLLCLEDSPVDFSRHEIPLYYFGSFTHQEDLPILTEAFSLLAQRGYHFTLNLIGGTGETLPFVKIIPIPEYKGHYPQFMNWLTSVITSGIALAPLVLDNMLNQGKSYLKYLDYTCLNCVGIYSPIPAYQQVITGKNGTLLPDNSAESWAEAILNYIEHPEKIQEHLACAKEDVKQNHFIQKEYPQIQDIWKEEVEG